MTTINGFCLTWGVTEVFVGESNGNISFNRQHNMKMFVLEPLQSFQQTSLALDNNG